ncbi:MAG: Co2+/Mg2+ efflux protein ApaG [Bdellovibrionota bacterium]
MRKSPEMESMNLDTVRDAVTVTEITDNIRVTVIPEYLEDHSEPARNSYAFSYTVTIENLGEQNVQLLRRHWVVNSGGAEYMQVKGDGVVGEQPLLEGSSGFRYSSGTVIKDPVGSMHGWYTFQRENGSEFDVTIPRFDLIYPHLLH